MTNRSRILVIFVVLIVMLFTLTIAVMAESNPTDVSSSHWAYKAVKILIDKGYLQLYQDQTFQGDKPVDRYTLAVVVAKILNEIAAGQVGTNKDDVALLKSLTNEFRDELVGVSSKSNIFMKKLDDVLKEDKVIKEDMTRLTDEQMQLQKEAQQMVADIQNIRDENTKLKADVERLRVEIAATKKQQNLYILIAIFLGLVGAAK
jgi:hypothetical protein